MARAWLKAFQLPGAFMREETRKDKNEIFNLRNGRGEWGKWFLEGALAEVGESFDLQRCCRS
jgi:hypothetical protein